MDNKTLDEQTVLLIAPGAAPLPKIEDETVALLAACNSVLNSLALQGAPIPKALLSDLSIFCRTNVGHCVPFADVAKAIYTYNPEIKPSVAIYSLGMAMKSYANDARVAITGIEQGESAGQLLAALAEMELVRERLCHYFGWSKILISAKARQLVNDRLIEQGGDGLLRKH
jgi:hypothetical protein